MGKRKSSAVARRTSKAMGHYQLETSAGISHSSVIGNYVGNGDVNSGSTCYFKGMTSIVNYT